MFQKKKAKEKKNSLKKRENELLKKIKWYLTKCESARDRLVGSSKSQKVD
jgi:hypothetical protein